MVVLAALRSILLDLSAASMDIASRTSAELFGAALSVDETTVPISDAIDRFYEGYDELCRGLQPRYLRAVSSQCDKATKAPQGGEASAADCFDNSAASVEDFATVTENEHLRSLIMSNFEVQSTNSLVFSLLQIGREDVPKLDEAAAELVECYQPRAARGR